MTTQGSLQVIQRVTFDLQITFDLDVDGQTSETVSRNPVELMLKET